MRRFFYFCILFYCATPLYSQPYGLKDLESACMAKNYQLVSQEMQIQKSVAESIQAGVWNNPTLSIGEVNLWKTFDIEAQRRLLGKYGKNQQISVEVEQLIETAQKRRKRVSLKQSEIAQQKAIYQSLEKELKWNIRTIYYELYRIKAERKFFETAINEYQTLIQLYQGLSEKQLVAKVDLIRLEAELLIYQKDFAALNDEMNTYMQDLIVYTQINDLKLDDIQFESLPQDLSKRIPLQYIEIALEHNGLIGVQKHQLSIAEQQWILEKAHAKPDLKIGLGYDRGGNIMKDFVGFGISMDLPVFNRNKGNIQAAQTNYTIEQTNKDALVSKLSTQVRLTYQQLLQYEKMLKEWPSDHLSDQQQLIEKFSKHLQEKQITLLQWIDFLQSVRQSQAAFQSIQSNYFSKYEELQYLVGKEF